MIWTFIKGLGICIQKDFCQIDTAYIKHVLTGDQMIFEYFMIILHPMLIKLVNFLMSEKVTL